MNIEQLKEKTAYNGMPQVWQRGFNVAVREMQAEIEKLKAENERLKASHARYETLRRLNVVQFKHLYTKALQSPITFDELVDMLGETK
jgi:FtsZ-binding cell division protein ZapB